MNTYPDSGMRSSTTEPIENRLLAALPEADLQRWRPHVQPVSLPAGTSLTHAGDSSACVVFPTTASVSLMHTTRDGESLEILAIGNEGMVGLQAILGGGSALAGALVRVGGEGYRVSKAWIQRELHGCSAVMGLMLRYAQTMMAHTTQAAVCNSHHSLEQRLCRCLLSTFDHGQGAPLHLTHESLSGMLGVRREGVTCAALKLQRAGVIHYARGRMAVVDRTALEARSCECYRIVKTAYDRMLPGAHPFTTLASRPPEVLRVAPAAHAAWATVKHVPHVPHVPHVRHQHRAYVEGNAMNG